MLKANILAQLASLSALLTDISAKIKHVSAYISLSHKADIF
jgi:hypothetical protein